MSKVKEFCKKHEKGIKRAGWICLGGGIVGGCVILHKKYMDSSPKAFITDPLPVNDGKIEKYDFEFGRITKLGRRESLGHILFSPENTLAFGKKIVDIVERCKNESTNWNDPFHS